jgi:hypothetical protein
MAKAEAVTRWSDETRTWQVRVGDFRTRDEAVALSRGSSSSVSPEDGSPRSRAIPLPAD